MDSTTTPQAAKSSSPATDRQQERGCVCGHRSVNSRPRPLPGSSRDDLPTARQPKIRGPTRLRHHAACFACITATGFGLTMLALYPGYLTNDATYVHSYIQDWHLGDWQSPLMTMLWWLIDPIAPGSGSMFLLIVTLYWLGFGLIALTVARRSAALACLVPLLGLTPPAFILLSMIWRDILFSGVWLAAAAIVYAVAGRTGPPRRAVQLLALVLIGFGVLLRPNAITAAPLLIAYAIWPTRFEWKRTALLLIPAVLACYGLIHLVYYDILQVKREIRCTRSWSSTSAASPISPRRTSFRSTGAPRRPRC